MDNGDTALFARVPRRIAPPNTSPDDGNLVPWNEVPVCVYDLIYMIAEGPKLAFLGLSR